MTVPDTPLFHFTSIHISSVSFRLFMSCPQNARERKGGTASGKIKGKREGISGSVYFSVREMLSDTEWPKQELSLHQWGPLTQAPQRLWGLQLLSPRHDWQCDWHQFPRQSKGCQKRHTGATVLGEPWQDVSPGPPHLSDQPASLPSDPVQSEDTGSF